MSKITVELFSTHHRQNPLDLSITTLPNKVTWLIVIVRFGSASAVWQWTLLCLFRQNIMCRDSTVSLQYTIFSFHVFHCYFILVKGSHPYVVRESSVVSMFVYGAGYLGSIQSCFLLITMCTMALEAVKFQSFNFLHLFISFLQAQSITRGAQLVSQRERIKIHQYFTTVKLYTLSK
jgi:hypothetical protein